MANSWDNSVIAKTAGKNGAALKGIFSESAVISFFWRDGYLHSAWEKSIVAKFLKWLSDIPRFFHPLYKKAGAFLTASIIYRLFVMILEKLHIWAALFLLLALIVPHGRWNNLYSFGAAVLLLILYGIRVMISNENPFQKRTLNIYLAIFILCVILSTAFSLSPSSSLRFLAFYLTCFIFMMLMVLGIRSSKELFALLNILLIGCTLSGLYGIYQFLVGIPVDPSLTDVNLNVVTFGRAYSSFDNANNFAEILVMFLPFYFAAFLNAKGILKKFFYFALFIPPMVALLLTLSRSGWIGFAVAVLVFIFFVKKWLIPFLLLIGIIAIPFLPTPIYRRILTIVNPADTSISTRFQLYQTVFPMLKDFWFSGLGLGNETFTGAIRNYFIHVTGGKVLQHSHNIYLQIWIETGIFGILSFLAFLISTFKQSVKTLWSPYGTIEVKKLKIIIVAALSSLMGVLVIGLAEYIWFYPRVMLFFWVIAGILISSFTLINKCKNSEQEDETYASNTPQECVKND